MRAPGSNMGSTEKHKARSVYGGNKSGLKSDIAGGGREPMFQEE